MVQRPHRSGKLVLATTLAAVVSALVAGLHGATAAPPELRIGREQVPTVTGDVTFDGLGTGPLPIFSFGFGLSQTESVAVGGGSGAGKAKFQDFRFTKPVDRSSPRLFLASATGRHIPKATIVVRKPNGQVSTTYTLEDVVVSSYQTSGSGDAAPIDDVSLAFRTIRVDVGGEVAGYDLARNQGI